MEETKKKPMSVDDLDLDKHYTYADYLQWTFDETVELIKGKIFRMFPGPIYSILQKYPCRYEHSFL